MAVRKLDEILDSFKSFAGDRITDDDAISILEDITDSYSSADQLAELQKKYDEDSAAWKQKYIDRFYSRDESVNTDVITESESDNVEDAGKNESEELTEEVTIDTIVEKIKED